MATKHTPSFALTDLHINDSGSKLLLEADWEVQRFFPAPENRLATRPSLFGRFLYADCRTEPAALWTIAMKCWTCLDRGVSAKWWWNKYEEEMDA